VNVYFNLLWVLFKIKIQLLPLHWGVIRVEETTEQPEEPIIISLSNQNFTYSHYLRELQTV
jgi:hypothetical protein